MPLNLLEGKVRMLKNKDWVVFIGYEQFRLKQQEPHP